MHLNITTRPTTTTVIVIMLLLLLWLWCWSSSSSSSPPPLPQSLAEMSLLLAKTFTVNVHSSLSDDCGEMASDVMCLLCAACGDTKWCVKARHSSDRSRQSWRDIRADVRRCTDATCRRRQQAYDRHVRPCPRTAEIPLRAHAQVCTAARCGR